ncbi:MAG: Hsp20/alpha crystallin family protein [Clostridiales bacterium]|nr:Hsp20/alpha crystallin family protein [Clostridiales bacterium]MDO4350543.1 Hsp20/alpha crystallin family protein [Eubacteriales bacterium]
MYTMVPFRRTMNAAFAPLFNDSLLNEFFGEPSMPEMRVDVREREGAYLLEADMPGLKKEDIKLNVNNGVLTISADLHSEKKNEQREGYVCSERRCGHVERSFNLEGIDLSGVKADYQNGVLMVLLPKQKAEEKKDGFSIAIGDDLSHLNENNK